MSEGAGTVRAMTDKRRSQRAKQARRDARRATKRAEASGEDITLADIVSGALAGHPGRMLVLASQLIDMAKPDDWRIQPGGREAGNLDGVLTSLISARNRETTALLAVIAEFLVNDPDAQLRCREELAQRHDELPRWIAALPQVDTYGAARISHVLGDLDELVIGARLGGHELTVVVRIEDRKSTRLNSSHLKLSRMPSSA